MKRSPAVYKYANDINWETAVYVARAMPQVPHTIPGGDGRYGNHLRLTKDTELDRCELLLDYAAWLSSPQAVRFVESLSALRGKDLVCWCAPKRCHAEVLLARVEGPKALAQLVTDLRTRVSDLRPLTLF